MSENNNDITEGQKVPLAKLLNMVSDQVREADIHARAKDGNAVMRFTECEIECAIDVELSGEGGVHVWVLDLKAGGKRGETNTIKVKYSAIDTKHVALIESEIKPTEKPKRTGVKVNGNK